jgi:DNA primase
MVQSIAKIPDRIKKEIYIQECARIMDISEEVLFNTLAQISQKEVQDLQKSNQQNVKTFEVHNQSHEVVHNKVNVLTIIEINVLSLLILYGHKHVTFDHIYIEIDEKGKEVEKVEKEPKYVFEKVYLSLQQDEIEFANPIFKEIYQGLLQHFQQYGPDFDKMHFMQTLPPEQTSIVTDIIMQNEKHPLHGWLEKKQVFVKDREDEETLARLVTDTMAAYREYLINKLNQDLMQQILNEAVEDKLELMTMINDYNKLKVVITRKIGRVRSTYV